MRGFREFIVRHSTFLIICAVSMLPLVSLFVTPEVPKTHDGFVHLVRIGAYFKAIADGQIFPRWVGDLNYGYGMPLFNFIYPLPFMVSSLFVALGTSIALSFKLSLAISYLLGGVGIYLFSKSLFQDKRTVLLVSLLYQFAPFRLIELSVRASFGELYTYAFIPFILYGIWELYKKPRLLYYVLTAVSTGLLVISHNSISLVFFGVAVLFALMFAASLRKLVWAAGSLFTGLLLSSWYWVPALVEHKYTLGDLYMKNLYLGYFAPLSHFFIPNLTNNISLQTQGISVDIGLFHILAIFVSLVYLFRRNKPPRTVSIIIFGLIIVLSALFIMQPVSIFLWKRISLLRQFQFPWRLLAPVTLATALMGAFFLQFRFFQNKTVYYALLTLIVLSTVVFWIPPLGYVRDISEGQYWNYHLDTTYFGETDVIWTAGHANSFPPSPIQSAAGDATISNLVKKTTKHSFTSTSTESATLVDNTVYFPGWNAYVDGVKVPIQFQDQNWRGMITFPVPSGTHSILVQFTDTKIRAITRMVSGGTFILLIILTFFTRRKHHE